MKDLLHHTSFGFHHNVIHKKREPHALYYLRQRGSFWLAVLSLFAFLIGNMMGQYGWYGFWASVLGKEEHIAYVGVTSPVQNVVDYGCWAQYGGDYKIHTYRQAPEGCLRPLPLYTSHVNRDDVYSMQYMSSYSKTTEHSGTHAGIDIRVPTGTPVQSVMNGRVTKVGNQPSGYGIYVVVEHPNVPDPDDPLRKTTTLYTAYAHLSVTYVEEGDLVRKGGTIALSGTTGKITGPHLHFEMNREDAPYLPYFPSSMEDGYRYTVNPMLYVQNNYPVQTTVVASQSDTRSHVVDPEDVVVPRTLDDVSRTPVIAQSDNDSSVVTMLLSRTEQRRAERLAQIGSRQTVAASSGFQSGVDTAHSSAVIIQKESNDATQVLTDSSVQSGTQKVHSVEVRHDGSFLGRGWEKVILRLVDEEGHTVSDPLLDRDVVLRAAYGTAEFRPSTVSEEDFEDGEAVVYMLPRGQRTVVIQVLPWNVISKPMRYDP